MVVQKGVRAMAEISETLRGKLEAAPHKPVDLIVRTESDPARFADRAAELGFSVKHQFRLLPGMAIAGPASGVPALLDEDWVVSVEEDRPVAASSEEVAK